MLSLVIDELVKRVFVFFIILIEGRQDDSVVSYERRTRESVGFCQLLDELDSQDQDVRILGLQISFLTDFLLFMLTIVFGKASIILPPPF